ncbi:ABC transporter ATP-binding protein [Thermosulfurimonas marina]|uniref:ABC transporter ATP-binding protein n=1 Tax=Thermosulfurimonas marina TaxID=2047767 RepID=A0A6H1WTD2_9BACT|nr:ABC transporter ATP-binding protein [Thermosulfurimonas marina]QJA06431.1 ABC transporter ATP-binding protein [Thermosulfurimonas marina]
MNLLELSEFRVQRKGFEVFLPGFVLREGERVAVLGPNGSGKSTFLAALAGLLPFEGRYLLLGRSFGGLSEAERYRWLSYLPQGGRVGLPFEVFYIVLTGRYPHLSGGDYRRVDLQATEEILRALDLEALSGRIFSELSGGERQRVWLARALNRGARVLLLDEPLSGMDFRHQALVLKRLREETARGAGILAVLHEVDLAVRHFERFILFKGGRGRVLAREDLRAEILEEVFEVPIRFWEDSGQIRVLTEV